MTATRPILAAVATVAALFTTTTAADAAVAPTDGPTASLSCTIDPARAKTVAAVTIRHATKPVRWSAFYVHTNTDTPDTPTTFVRGRVVEDERRVLRFRFGPDDLLSIKVWRGDKKLLRVAADQATGCGTTSTTN